MSTPAQYSLEDGSLDAIMDDFGTRTRFDFLVHVEPLEDSLGYRVMIGEGGALGIAADRSLTKALSKAVARALVKHEELSEKIKAEAEAQDE